MLSSRQHSHYGYIDFALAYFQDKPSFSGQLYNYILGTKGIIFASGQKMRTTVLDSGDPEFITLYEKWKNQNDYLVRVWQMSTAEKESNSINTKAEEEKAYQLERQIAQKANTLNLNLPIEKITWQDVKNKLKAGEAAIEIIRSERQSFNDDNPHTVYAALIITPQTESYPEMVVLENGADLDGKFSKYYRNAIKQKIRDEMSYIQFWKPIVDKLKAVKKVFISSDGVYNQINLNTLYNPANRKYVIDEMEVQVVTSTKEILIKANNGKNEIRDAILFGFPNYNNSEITNTDSSRSLSLTSMAKTDEIKSDSAQRFFDGENITELPGTKIEVETIKALLKKRNIVMREYLFDEATESEIKRLNNPQVLHIATHGFFLSDITEPKVNERGFAGMDTKKIVENPLLRSGLLFAGVKNAFQSRATTPTGGTTNGEDGILTAYEAMNLKLDKTDLVVMSACETGLGVTANGEGVYGLQRAFQVAGAKSVLMSLWTVSDEATQKLMTLFYENWLSGKTPREAFRMAQLSLRTKYPEPYYWGAFVLVGN